MSVLNTSIEWTDATWSPVRGCSRVSPGCDACYAMGQAHRFSGPGKPFEGLTTIRRGKVDWSGRVRLVPEMLDVPLRRRKPTTYFVNSMSDLFHDHLSNEQIAAVFGVMAACPRHTFQVLTKRAKRMREWFEWVAKQDLSESEGVEEFCVGEAYAYEHGTHRMLVANTERRWPLPNVWLGISAEDQQRADERIPHLLATPAAVRFVSAEPLLGPIDFSNPNLVDGDSNWLSGENYTYPDGTPWQQRDLPALDWCIVGSESGPRARPMQIEWARSIVDQCLSAGVAVFTKQIANERDRKGGNPVHWPEGVWPREMPEARQ